MNTYLLIAGLCACALVLALSAYALHLWRKVWQHKKNLQAHEQQVADKLQHDLRVLCGSLLDEQVPWLEGCIRIKVILEHYSYALSREPLFKVFLDVHAATEHVPTHEAWKALDKLERRKHEAAFAMLEEQHRNDSLKAASALLEQLGGRISAAVAAPVQSWSPQSAATPAPTLH